MTVASYKALLNVILAEAERTLTRAQLRDVRERVKAMRASR